jgi:hypothetical protein
MVICYLLIYNILWYMQVFFKSAFGISAARFGRFSLENGSFIFLIEPASSWANHFYKK